MKKLSDYQGDEAIELWADLLEPMTQILGDKEIAAIMQSSQPTLLKARAILKKYKKETGQILLRIDPEPLDGLNIIVRLVAILAEIGEREDVRSFFGFAGQAKQEGVSTGLPTENIEESEN